MAKLTLGERINAFFLKMLSKFFLNYKQDLNPLDFKKGIIFCQMGIGNCILFLPVIKNLLIRRPDLELVILTNKKVIYEILNDQFQKPRIILADLRNYSFLKKINFYYKMRKEKFDFSIMNFLGQSKENIQLHLIAGIPFRIGHTLKDSGGRGKYDFLFNYPLSIQGKHELDFNFDLLTPLNIEKDDKNTFLNINFSDTSKAKSFINSLSEQYKIVFQVYSSMGVQKNWIDQYYIQLCQMIKHTYDAAIILAGSDKERSFINKIFSNVSFDYYNIAGNFSIMEIAEIIRMSNLFIGNDSGLGHIAAALGQNTLSIIAMTDYNRIGPRGSKVTVFREELSCSPCDAIGVYPLYLNCPYDYLCKKRITPDKVFNTVQKILQ